MVVAAKEAKTMSMRVPLTARTREGGRQDLGGPSGHVAERASDKHAGEDASAPQTRCAVNVQWSRQTLENGPLKKHDPLFYKGSLKPNEHAHLQTATVARQMHRRSQHDHS